MSSPDRSRIPDALHAIARKKRFLSHADLCVALNIPEDSCHEAVSALIDEGVLRSVASGAGQPFYWISLPPKPATDG